MTGAVLNTQGFGNRPESVEVPVISPGNPNEFNLNYPVGKRWINTTASAEYVLTSKQSSLGDPLSIWSQMAIGNLYISAVGIAQMANGTVTVTEPTCRTTSTVLISPARWNGNGQAFVNPISNGSFVIDGGSVGETSLYYYMVIN